MPDSGEPKTTRKFETSMDAKSKARLMARDLLKEDEKITFVEIAVIEYGIAIDDDVVRRR
jgi:hypothetical protein